MNLINCIIMIFLTTFTIAADPPIDIVFIIQSHGTKHRGEIKRKLKANIIKQSVNLESNYRIRVHLVDEIYNSPGSWTILNLIPQLMFQRKPRKQPYNHNDINNQMDSEIINDNTRWIVFCEDITRVKLKILTEKLNDENHTLTPVKQGEIYFAVKTCSKYHSERLSIIKATWAPYAKHIKYFSDIQGVCQILGCYNSLDEIYLGERYGYRLYAEDGFNYITGGGGIAFSLPVVKLILQHCSCPSPTAPDDMILGSCLHSLQIKALHSPRFHQARPNDYPLELLKQELPASFHKFWQIDAIDVYNQLFAAQDRQFLAKENLYHAQLNNDDYRLQTLKLFGKAKPLKASSKIYQLEYFLNKLIFKKIIVLFYYIIII